MTRDPSLIHQGTSVALASDVQGCIGRARRLMDEAHVHVEHHRRLNARLRHENACLRAANRAQRDGQAFGRLLAHLQLEQIELPVPGPDALPRPDGDPTKPRPRKVTPIF